MTMTKEPAKLAPIGETDVYAYANGVIVYWGREQAERKHERTVSIHGGMDQRATVIPADLYGVLYAVLYASGLGQDDCALLVEAAEAYA